MLGLYIHIPFCKRKCNYCDFVSFTNQNNLFESYLNALSLEMSKYTGIFVETLYIGGGTPTILTDQQLIKLIKLVRNNFNCRCLSETTIEANPESLSDEKLRVIKAAGINRLSIGVQSFSDKELRFLGRIHTSSDFQRAFKSARKYEISNINIDLIYGLPNQLLTEWKNNLKEAVSLKPEHISLYPLTIEQGTQFYNQQIVINEDAQADMYEWSMDYMKQEGYEHYEISNWARSGYKCKHNLTYWQNREYIGLGVSAASYFKRKRYKNFCSLSKYIERINLEESALEEEEIIDEFKKLTEDMILKLRCMNGIELSETINQKYGNTIKQMIEQQLLEKVANNIRLTNQGKLLANQVLEKFV